MSSILDALKKLESGHSPQKDRKLWIKRSVSKNSIADRFEEFWMSIRYPFLMLGIIFFIVFLGFILSFQSIESGIFSPSFFSFFQGDRNTESIPLVKEMKQHVEQTDRIKRHILPINQIPATTSKTVNPDRKPRNILDAENINGSKSSIDKGLQSLQDPSAYERHDENIEEGIHGDQEQFLTEEAPKSENVIPPSESEIEIMNDSRLKLQAISWSKHPENSIAVINSRIVHQGDLVDGFSVLQINQDDVTVASGDNMWKLIFSTR